jgi:hypothetical protein
MIGRNVPLERKLIEQRDLLNSLMSHHDSVLSKRLNQRTSTRATEDFFNTIGPIQTLLGKGLRGERCWQI